MKRYILNEDEVRRLLETSREHTLDYTFGSACAEFDHSYDALVDSLGKGIGDEKKSSDEDYEGQLSGLTDEQKELVSKIRKHAYKVATDYVESVIEALLMDKINKDQGDEGTHGYEEMSELELESDFAQFIESGQGL
jgi:hypothetical protein